MGDIRERIARALWARESLRCGLILKDRTDAPPTCPAEFTEDADAVLEALAPELALIKQARWDRQQDVGF